MVKLKSRPLMPMGDHLTSVTMEYTFALGSALSIVVQQRVTLWPMCHVTL